MTRRRIVVDFEFTVDDEQFKAAALSGDPTGVADVSDAAVRDAVTRLLIETDWATLGLRPLRTVVIPRMLTRRGWYDALHLERDRGVAPATEG